MNEQRKQRLDALLSELCKCPGTISVESDDFNSTYIDVFIELKPKFAHHNPRSPVFEWETPLRSVKAFIRKVCNKHGVPFNWLDYPKMKYDYSERPCMPLGYDRTHLKLEVAI